MQTCTNVNAFLNFYENFLYKLKPVVYSLDPSYCSYSDTGTASKFGSGRIRVRDKSIVTKFLFFLFKQLYESNWLQILAKLNVLVYQFRENIFVET